MTPTNGYMPPAPPPVVWCGGRLNRVVCLIETNLKEIIVNHEAMTEESLRMCTKNIACRPDETLVFALID